MASSITISRREGTNTYVLSAPKVLNRWDLTVTNEVGSADCHIFYKDVQVLTIPKNGTFPQTFMRWLKANGAQGIAEELFRVQEATEDLAPGRDYNKVVEFARNNRKVVHEGFTL